MKSSASLHRAKALARPIPLPAKADVASPETEYDLWQSPQQFFRAGGTRDWASLLSAEDLAHFGERLHELGFRVMRLDQIEVAEHDAEEIVQIVRDALRHRADRRGAPGFLQAALQVDHLAIDRDEAQLGLNARERLIGSLVRVRYAEALAASH